MTTNTELLKLAALLGRVPKSRSSIYQGIKDGTFPAPIRIGARAVAWLSTDIEAWQQACIQASKAK